MPVPLAGVCWLFLKAGTFTTCVSPLRLTDSGWLTTQVLCSKIKINLYGPDDLLLRTMDMRPILSEQLDLLFWRPDSQGFYFTTANSLYYLSLPDGEPVLIDPALPVGEYWWDKATAFGWLMSR